MLVSEMPCANMFNESESERLLFTYSLHLTTLTFDTRFYVFKQTPYLSNASLIQT